MSWLQMALFACYVTIICEGGRITRNVPEAKPDTLVKSSFTMGGKINVSLTLVSVPICWFIAKGLCG